MTTLTVSRRKFMQGSAATGAALALEFSIPGSAFAQKAGAAAPSEVTAWILIYPDDKITIRVARSEMGQGASALFKEEPAEFA